MCESLEEKSLRVNGWCQRKFLGDNLERNIYFNPKIDIRSIYINSLSQFISVITDCVKFNYKYPVFYRAHANANYINIPSSMRSTKAIENEAYLLNEFQRRYPKQFGVCRNTLEKLVMMQHYGSYSRCLDITESPLIALAFACIEEKKFNSGNDNEYRYATITAFKTSDEEDIKCYDSYTAGVIANCAGCNPEFTYGDLELRYFKDGYANKLDNFIYFRDIIRRSVIVRTKSDNPRIRNQRGAFILCNANEVKKIPSSCNVIESAFMDFFLRKKDIEKPVNLERLENGKRPCLCGKDAKVNEWDFKFLKIEPYSLNNNYAEYREDPFDLKRLFLRDDRGCQIVFFISPKAKQTIKKQLELIGITYDFLYPEVDTVFHEIREIVCKGD